MRHESFFGNFNLKTLCCIADCYLLFTCTPTDEEYFWQYSISVAVDKAIIALKYHSTFSAVPSSTIRRRFSSTRTFTN